MNRAQDVNRVAIDRKNDNKRKTLNDVFTCAVHPTRASTVWKCFELSYLRPNSSVDALGKRRAYLFKVIDKDVFKVLFGTR